MKKKTIALFLAALMLLALAAGCNKDQGQQPNNGGSESNQGEQQNQNNDNQGGSSGGEKTLVVRMTGDPQTFNPDTTGDDNAYAIVQNVFNRLCKLDCKKDVIPDLAESWDISDDGDRKSVV